MARPTGHRSLKRTGTEPWLDKTRPVRQYSMTGRYIAEYQSLHKISLDKSLVWNTRCIWRCCIRKTLSSYNNIWRFADDDEFAGTAQSSSTIQTDVPEKAPVIVLEKPKQGVENKPVMKDIGVYEPDVRFTTPLRASRDLVVQYVDRFGRYSVLDIESGNEEYMSAAQMFWAKVLGDSIGGVAFHTNGLLIELGGYAPYVVPLEVWREFVVEKAQYRVSNLGRICRLVDGVPQMVSPTRQTLLGHTWYYIKLEDGEGDFIERDIDTIVASAFVLEPDMDSSLEHLDGNIENWALGNLSCCVDSAEFGRVPVEPISAHMFSGIMAYTLGGKFEHYYNSISEASVLSGVSVEDIRRSCERSVLSSQLYVWRYDDDNEFSELPSEELRQTFGNFVRQYNSRGSIVSEYKTVSDAAKATGYSEVSLAKCCAKDKSVSSVGGYVWRLFKDDEFYFLSEEERVQKLPLHEVRQYSLEGDVIAVFGSANEASTVTGIPAKYIEISCEDKSFNIVGDYIWRYVSSDNLLELSKSRRLSALGFKPVRQYSRSGMMMGEYTSMQLAHRKTGEALSAIKGCCDRQDILDKCGDYVWRYVGSDELEAMRQSDRAKYLGYSRVRCYSLQGTLLREYETLEEASKATRQDIGKIDDICNGVKQPRGSSEYAWKYSYADDLLELSIKDRTRRIQESFVEVKITTKVPVKAVRQYALDGRFVREHASAETAFADTRILDVSILDCCNGKRCTAGDFVWRYAENDDLEKLSQSERVNIIWYSGKSSSKETWRPVTMYGIRSVTGDYKYEVSTFGNVRERGSSELLTQTEVQYGRHLAVTLVDDSGSQYTVRVDKLVALAFLEKEDGCETIWHKDNDIQNNRADNLSWRRSLSAKKLRRAAELQRV